MPAKNPQEIRNIALVGHGGAGKTTLAEGILNVTGATNRFGTIEDGTTVMDHLDVEKEKQHSVDPAMAHAQQAGKTINVIDTPGYPDFIGGAIAALGGTDTAVIVVSASAGIEVSTRRMFNDAGKAGLARALVVNKIDAENVDLPALVAALTETFGPAVKCMNLPADGGKKVVDVFTNDSGEA
ncbi:hypothetical protein LCGC14_2149170, partial [marine sediment metagenome]